MLHPIGDLPPSVYWRRRLFVLAPILAIGLTVYVACSGGGGSPSAAGSTPAGSSTSAHSSVRSSQPSTHASTPSKPTTSKPTTSKTTTSKPATSSHPPTSTAPAVPTTCVAKALRIAAATGATSYAVGAQPVLYLQVTNVGQVPCVADLSDPQIVLAVYNGASRVWGSHDCQIAPGSSPQTLAVNMPIRRSITWTGLSSEPQQCTNRQRVGAGTYTLHASLGGVEGSPAQFQLT